MGCLTSTENMLPFTKLIELLHANSWARMPNHRWQKLENVFVKWSWCIVIAPHWLDIDLLAELWMETCVSNHGIATLLLQ